MDAAPGNNGDIIGCSRSATVHGTVHKTTCWGALLVGFIIGVVFTAAAALAVVLWPRDPSRPQEVAVPSPATRLEVQPELAEEARRIVAAVRRRQ